MSKSILTPHGHSVETGPHGEIVTNNLYTCCHCQKVWEASTGSLGGKMAGGFCGKCVGYICRNPDCLTCLPWEARLENIEAGRHYLTERRTLVSVPDMEMIVGATKQA